MSDGRCDNADNPTDVWAESRVRIGGRCIFAERRCERIQIDHDVHGRSEPRICTREICVSRSAHVLRIERFGRLVVHSREQDTARATDDCADNGEDTEGCRRGNTTWIRRSGLKGAEWSRCQRGASFME